MINEFSLNLSLKPDELSEHLLSEGLQIFFMEVSTKQNLHTSLCNVIKELPKKIKKNKTTTTTKLCVNNLRL